jgi:lipoyl(octanoyl) transferase
MSYNSADIEWIEDRSLIDFSSAINFMEDRVAQIASNKAREAIWILEHNPVYTAGISAKDEDLLLKNHIPIFKTNRGGKYTYHGPGMKIVYAMLDLKKLFYPTKPDISLFIEFLERWIIDVLLQFKIQGEIRSGRVGVWVLDKNSEKKIAAIGVKIKKWISYHGFAINVNPDLAPFQNIVPCGIKNFGITSLEQMGVRQTSDINKILRDVFELKLRDFCNMNRRSKG